jgi:hypothetical protein
MDGWGRNIAPEMLHVSVGYISGAQIAWASKRALGYPPKLDMFK